MKVLDVLKGKRGVAANVLAAFALLFSASMFGAALTISMASNIAVGTVGVRPCDTQFTLTLGDPFYDPAVPGYVFRVVRYAKVDASACEGQTLRVTVASATGKALAAGATIVTETKGVIPIGAVPASQAATVYGVISGPVPP